jgi:hypothetical protein
MRQRRRTSHDQFIASLAGGPRPVPGLHPVALPTVKVLSSTGVVHAARVSDFGYITGCTGMSLTAIGTDQPVTCKACIRKGFVL